MQIFLRTLNGKTTILEVETSDSVATIKSKVEFREGIPLELQSLVYSGKQMRDDRILSDYQVQSDTTLHLVIRLRGIAPVFAKVSPNGKTLEIDVDLGRHTVLDVKKVVEERLKIGPEMQRLIYAGKELEDARPLKEYGVKNEATLHVVPRLPGK